jgi:hypothetical protein
MTKLLQFILLLGAALTLTPRGFAKKAERPPLPQKIMRANAVYIDCVCPRALAVARGKALEQLQIWGRFQLVESPRGADLVFLFSGNPYLGDYLTRDGPDTRPVFIESTIMTVIDANTGRALWTDSRRWGSWRVAGATKDLMDELRELMASQVRKWTLNDLLMCGVAPVYKVFDHVTPEEAMKSGADVSPIPNKPDRLSLESPVAPVFCRNAQLVVGPEGKIVGFEVSVSQADDLDIDEVLQHADRFDFTGGKYSNGATVYFSAESKDKKIRIQFDVQGHRSVLSSVSYSY